MVPKEELYERKLRCVFKYSPPEISDEKGCCYIEFFFQIELFLFWLNCGKEATFL